MIHEDKIAVSVNYSKYLAPTVSNIICSCRDIELK